MSGYHNYPSGYPYSAPPSQNYSSAPYGAPASGPPQPGQSSAYAPVGTPYSAPSAPPNKPPKDNPHAHGQPSAPYGAPQHYGGYPAPPPSAPYGSSPFASLVPSTFPPGTDPNVIACFQVADQDGSGLIDDKELQRALSSYNQSFSLRTVHLLMYLFTNTNTRKIGMHASISFSICVYVCNFVKCV
ncbi:probable calcium-binding protein CML49 [Olea europaea var. sylvestris]|uniref:probable calcium-binding protein CML49 n=1 Tax=Olea europaea var. sylvestris TaxID=158386 RepID=UPI000C1D0E53|nr:probable calcium-binding protein CML49 [Olea europaea var. sylvestris]